jgi:signal transduction histidine kinase/DNA-binding response OmpR family regulator
MILKQITPLTGRRLAVTIILIAVAASLRIWPLHSLKTALVWLTFYPAVMVIAIYGGLFSGLIGTALACLIAIYGGPLLVHGSFISKPADWIGLSVFVMTGTMISSVAEAMRRANVRAKLAQDKAEAANKAKSTFLASMSHELRTPLNAILGFSNLLRDDENIPKEQRKTLDIINRSGEYLLSLINAVLDMARIESGRTQIETSVFDLGEMVRDVADLMSVRAEEKELQLRLDQSPAFQCYVRADAGKLRQVLINLVGNAIKFTEQGSVTLRLNAAETAHGLMLLMDVEDTGIGIAKEDQARIFEPFVQVGKLTSQKGTGLGLAITREYIELMGGKISVESAPGQGTKFHLRVPVERADESDANVVKARRGKVIGLAQDQPGMRVLIVEDQIENWLLLKQMLELVGFQVHVAGNGEEGIREFQAWHPHFIWMDIRMPVMNGLEATRRIREMPGGREVKIAALTASVFKEERDQVLAAGMDGFVRKPYQADEIFDCLARHLNVHYIYADAAPAAGAQAGLILRTDDLAALPPELRRELTNALTRLDAAQINAAIRRISDQDSALGDALVHYAGQLKYTAILQALKSFEEVTP